MSRGLCTSRHNNPPSPRHPYPACTLIPPTDVLAQATPYDYLHPGANDCPQALTTGSPGTLNDVPSGEVHLASKHNSSHPPKLPRRFGTAQPSVDAGSTQITRLSKPLSSLVPLSALYLGLLLSSAGARGGFRCELLFAPSAFSLTLVFFFYLCLDYVWSMFGLC